MFVLHTYKLGWKLILLEDKVVLLFFRLNKIHITNTRLNKPFKCQKYLYVIFFRNSGIFLVPKLAVIHEYIAYTA